jgi:hypothetical protein
MRLQLAGILVVAWAALAGAQSAPFDRDTFARARDLLKAERFGEASALLEPLASAANPEPAPVYLLGLVKLQEGRLDQADAQLARLRGLGTPAAASLADKLAAVLAGERQNAAARAEFVEAVRQLDGSRARALLDRLTIDETQRAILAFHLEMYAGRMSTAILTLNSPALRSIPPSMRDAMRADLTVATGRFRSITEQLRWYTDSSLAMGACRPTDARERSVRSGFVIAEYVQLTEMGLQLFPFNDALMDAAFHGALLSEPYDDVKRLGLEILRAKGELRIPFYSSTARFDLVVDGRNRRISSQLATGDSANPFASEALGKHVLFELPFDRVVEVKQSAKTQLSTMSLAPDSYALRLSPSGQAPHYLLMSAIHCLYGEETQKTITLSLGRFVVDVVAADRKLRTELENPAKQTRDRLQLFSQIIGTGTIVAAQAAEQLGREPEKYDGRMSGAEVLQQTAGEAQALMTRRLGLLRARESLLASQKEAGRTWAESLAYRALDRTHAVLAQRIDGLVALAEVK